MMMDLCVFSKKGILYSNSEKGPLVGIAVPAIEQKKQFADMSTASKNTIKEHYGIIEGEPLYRNTAGVVTVYGVLPKVLYNLRSEVKVFLLEDLFPTDVNVIYAVIGPSLIVHSVRSFDTEGNVSWASIHIELERGGAGPAKILENLISERLVSNNDEKVMVAYFDLDENAREDLIQNLSPLGVSIEDLASLKHHKTKQPLYYHRDNSVIMLIFILMAVMLCALSAFYFMTGKANLSESDERIKQLRMEYKQSLSKRKLQKVTNPQDVKKSIEKTFRARPSAIIHSASEVASLFGEIISIELQKRETLRTTRVTINNPEDEIIYVLARVRSIKNDQLLDQERLAKSVYETRKWIRSIERSAHSGDGTLLLRIGVYVDNSSGGRK